MSEQDPKRLFEGGSGAPGELRSLLDAGRSEVPSDGQMMLLAAKIGVLGGLGGAGAAGAAGAGGGGAAGAGGAGAAGAGGGAGAAGAGAGGAAGAGAAGVKVAGAAASAAKAGLALKVIGAVAIAGAAGTGAVVVSSRHVEPPAPVGIVATELPSASARTNANTNANATPSASTSAEVAEEPAVVPSASAVASTARPARSAATTAPNIASAEVRDEGPQAEVKLLERAQDALRSRPAEALALCNDHAQRFPNGMLVQEREMVAIEALVKTGRKDDARKRADRFRTRFPGSTHTRRLDVLLAN